MFYHPNVIYIAIYYSRYVDIASKPVGIDPSYECDMNIEMTIKPEWKQSASNWLYSVPEGIADILR